jgi:menaquinol-cytochrome c reductase iron-sulfur subunit
VAETQEPQHDEMPEHDADNRSAPAPSVLPIGFAAGIAVLLVGVVLNWVVFGIGLALVVVFGYLWVWQGMQAKRPGPAEPEQADEHGEDEAERYGRNVFLERTTLGLGALIGVGITVPIVGFAVAPTFVGQGDDDIDLGPLDNFPEGEWRVAKFTSVIEHGQVSDRAAFVRYNGLANAVPSVTILSSRCVHVGCPTRPAGKVDEENAVEVELEGKPPVQLIPAQASGFTCPCHGGSYDEEGNRVAGPPVRALDRYSYKIVGGNLVLAERFSVGKVIGEGAEAKIEAYTRFDPGQHVDGPTDFLYPASPQGI